MRRICRTHGRLIRSPTTPSELITGRPCPALVPLVFRQHVGAAALDDLHQALIAQHAKASDVVITTALVPGRPAPVLLTSGAVVSMAAGSVIVDLAAEQGGNCPLTERDKMVEKFGKKILGFTDLASRLARQISDAPSAGRRPRT